MLFRLLHRAKSKLKFQIQVNVSSGQIGRQITHFRAECAKGGNTKVGGFNFFCQSRLQRRGFGLNQSGHQRRQIYPTARLVDVGNNVVARFRHLDTLFMPYKLRKF